MNCVGNVLFGVFSMFALIIRPYNLQSPVLFHGNLCKPKVPTKVSFFIWTMALGKILTVDNLRRRKLVAVDWCYMCKRSGEIVDHLFLHCPVAQELWNMVCSVFGVDWVMPCGVVDLLASWSGRNCRFNTKLIWRGIHILLKGMKGQFVS